MIYLDHAAATPLSDKALVAMSPYWAEEFYNPSSSYAGAVRVKQAIRDARARIAATVGAKRDEIIFAAGATEANAIAIKGVMERHDGSVVYGATEHAAVREIAGQYNHAVAEVDGSGRILLDQLEQSINDQTVLISVAYADSELGTVQPLREVVAIVNRVRHDRRARSVARPLYVHTDASQAFGLLDCHVSRLGVDMMTLNAGKCYGPKQSAVLWVRSGIDLVPYLPGGGQESGVRSGTESAALVAGMAAAMEQAHGKRTDEPRRIAALRDQLQHGLLSSDIADLITVNGHQKYRLPGHLHVSIDGCDAERLLYALDYRGVMVSTGAACAANKQTRSSVLEAVGMPDNLADSSIRMSLGRLNSEADIEIAVREIVAAAKQEIALS